MNDDTLTLYYYNDGLSDRERREVEKALKADTDLATRYAALRRELECWSELDVESAPSYMVERWHDAIDRAARREYANQQQNNSSFSFLSFAWGVAITAALAIGIGIGAYFSADNPSTSAIDTGIVSTTPHTARTVPASFTRGLQVHLRDAQRDINSLPIDTSADRTMLVMQIIQQNRMFERAAEQNDSEGLARVLRAFEPILLRLAADDIAPEDAEELRQQLAFELKVMLTILERNTSKETHTT